MLLLLAALLALASTPASSRAADLGRPGCCSSHGGLCGCRCCDGSPLSAKCAPYYPSCGSDSTPPTPRPAYRAAPTAAPAPSTRARLAGALQIGATYYAQVVDIVDGDTLDVQLSDGSRVRLRLAGIDAPEEGQAFGPAAKQALSQLCLGKSVRFVVTELDRYQRPVAEMKVGEYSVNRTMVASGYAWWYRSYSRNAELRRSEEQARAKRAGLWQDANPVPPWEWRKEPAPVTLDLQPE